MTQKLLAPMLGAALVALVGCSEKPSTGQAETAAAPTPAATTPAAPAATTPAAPAAPTTDVPSSLRVAIDYRKLENGLRVVLAPDSSVPTATVAVYYNIGFRIEPQGRTGFAHLFEHLMFQGSANLGKAEFVGLVQSSGGTFNGSTRFDFTNYFQVVPSNKAETILWAEADRMRTLAITQENLTNQQEVVKNEVRVNVLNRPYGSFPWLLMPQAAFGNWYNSHNFYGDLADLDAATLEDARTFFESYYPPNNAVVVIAGDIDVERAFGWAQKYFGDIPSRPVPPLPDISEAPQTAEKVVTQTDPTIPRPAVAFAYRVPERLTPEWYAMGLIDSILTDGDDGLLVQKLVKEKAYAGGLQAGINFGLGNMFNYNGPMLWTVGLIHDPSAAPTAIVADAETVLETLRTTPVPVEDLDLARTRIRSSLYDLAGSSNRFGLVDLLAVFALFNDNPALVNELEKGFAAVTPELIQKTAQTYLQPTGRTVLVLEPAAKPSAPGGK